MVKHQERRWRSVRLSVAGVASMTLLTGLTIVGSPASAITSTAIEPATGGATVEDELLDDLASEDTATFWVYLRQQADTSAAAEMADRADQGWFVYEELTETAEESQAGLVALLDEAGVEYESFWIANTIKVTGGDAELLDRIAARPEVEQITGDRVYELPEPAPAEEEPGVAAVEWNIDRVKAPQVWDTFGVTGEDIVVGAVDSGAQFDHPALVNQYRGNNGDGTFDHNYNWWDPSNVCGSPSLVPCDNTDHGTHVTGTMVGDDGGDNQIGMAPGAKWIIAKGCESNNCSQSALLSSGQFILAPTDLQGDNPNPEMRPHIVNNSWGGGATTDPWYRPTVQAWVDAGIFPQFASGNPGSACGAAGNPGNLPESYAAGAFDINDNLYVNSGRGPSAWGAEIIKPNITAPGVAVRSSVAGNGYASFTGTSMASPHVSGAVALLWSAAPSLVRDIDSTRELLDLTAEDTEDLTCGGEPGNNNVWGQGKLDAFLAVEDSPRGPTGLLTGTVRDAGTGDPIAGATVTITGEVDRQRTADADGDYAITLPVGGYDVTASAFGYAPATDQVTITEDQTTTQDFNLAPVDSVTVSGTVTDGSGHGWPVYASVDVEGTSVSTFTDPVTGEYNLTLPVDNTYTLVVEPEYPGYGGATETVGVGESDVTVNVSLTVSSQQCRSAPGYELDQPAMAMITSNPGSSFSNYFEDRGVEVDFFTAAQIDQITGYDVVLFGYNPTTVNDAAFLDLLDRTDAEGTGVIFLDHGFTTHNGIRTLSRVTGNPDSTGANTAGTGQETLYEVTQAHPILDGFEIGDQIIVEPGLTAWIAWFDGYEGEGREVIADVGRTGDGIFGSGIGVQERANNRHALLSMHSQTAGRGPSGWSDEHEEVFWNAIDWAAPGDASFECLPVEGGLVLGHVNDANTGDGVNSARVTSDGNPDEFGDSFATPDDPALDDGFYWLFSSLTGGRQFTASAGNYVDDTRAVSVAADAANEANFTLAAGQLTVDPTEVDATVRLGQSASRTFTITNTGTAPAEVELDERLGGFEILGGESATSGQPWVPADLTPNPDYDPNSRTTEGQYLDGSTPQIRPTAPGDVLESWAPTGLALAWGVGYDGDVWLSDIPNNDTNTEFTVDGQPTGTSHTTPWVGVWPGDMAALTDQEMCQVNVGGDNGIYCWDKSSGNVTRSITGSFPWTSISQRGLAYRPDDDTFYIGGWNQNILYQVRGFSHPTPGEVVGQCSFSGMGISGLAWNPTAEIVWIATNSATDAIHQVDTDSCELLGSLPHPTPDFNGGGLHMDDSGNLWMISQTNSGAQNLAYLVDSGVPHASDVPWLARDPETATLQPGGQVRVTVSMDSSATDEGQPGAYTAAVGIRHDTPYSVDPVGVTMNVTPPNNWGKITGTVTSVACDGEEAPLPGATVQIDGRTQDVTLSTGADGGYAYWLPVADNPLTMIVALNGHHPQTRDTQLIPGMTVAEDFTLAAICTRASEGEVTPV